MSYPRFIAKVEKDTAYLFDEELRHAKVKRLKLKDFIEINDLNGNIYLCQIEEITKKYLKAKIIKKLQIQQSLLKINLFLCVPNQLSKVDDLIPYLSELGAYSLTPVICKNSAIKKDQILKKIDKWEKIALNSIKQCKRLFPIKINKPVDLKNVKSDSDFKIVFYEKEKERVLKNYCNKNIKSVDIFIGNEGGFRKEEIDILKGMGFLTFSLGNLILRMETAVITAVCQVKFCLDR